MSEEEKKDKEKDPKATKAEAPEKDTQESQTPAEGDSAEETSKFKVFLDALSARERIVALTAVVVISTVIIDAMVVRPIAKNLDGINARINESETIIPRRLRILRYEKKILQENESLNRYKTPSGMTREEEIHQLLRDIERVSNESGLFISNINPVEVVDAQGDRYFLKVLIDGKGELNYIRRYISLLEKSNPSIRVGHFNFSAKKKGSEELTYSITILKLGVQDT